MSGPQPRQERPEEFDELLRALSHDVITQQQVKSRLKAIRPLWFTDEEP